MKKEASSLKRKEQMAESLKKLMTRKSFQKITIQDIADDCGINRYTFYYHFKDIYDLLSWAFQNEALSLLQKSENCSTWQEGFRLFLQYTKKNRQVFRCALDGVGQQVLRDLLYREFSHIMDLYLLDYRGKNKVSEEFQQFLRNFYIAALSGIVIDWIRTDLVIPEETLLSYLHPVMGGHAVEEAFRQAELNGL